MLHKTLFCFMVSILLLSGVFSYAQDNSQFSIGQAPYSTVKPEQAPFYSPLSPTSRGFVYISGTSSHQLNKQFMGNVSVTPVGSPFTTAGWIGATTRNPTTGVLYVCNQASPFQIWTVDTNTGLTTIAVSSCSGLPQTNFTGMVWDHTTNTMYGISSSLSASSIFTINMSTGVCTPVGSPSTVITGGISLACAPNGTLFSHCIVTNNLYKWNKTTGVATLVGPLGFDANYGQDAAFDLSDGVLFLNSAGPGNMLRICDTTTGSATTVVGTYAGQPSCLTVVAGSSGPIVPTGTWTEQTSGVTTALYSVSAVNDDIAWIGGASGKVLRTINKGGTWTSAGGNIPTGESVYCIYGFDANTCIVTTSPTTGTFIYKTTNGGVNWTTVLSQTGGFMDGFVFLNATTGFAYGDPVGNRWSLFKTTDAGSTWDSSGLYVASGTLAGWNNAMFNLGNKIWFGTNGTALPYSSNAGVTWTSQTTPAANQYAIWFNNDNTGLSGGANINITTNGGTTWTALTTIGSGNVSGIVGVSTSWWFTRQATAVNYSSNNGTTWSAQYTAPAGSFYHLALSRSGATIWGVRSNGGISRYGQPNVGVNPISSQTPVEFSLSQNYPNPFNPVTNIKFALPKTELVTLKVYDALGKEVATLVNEVKTAGTYNVDFNASSLSSGVYFYKLTSGDFSSVKKMMLIK